VTPLTRRRVRAELARLQMVFQNPYSSLNPRRRSARSSPDALDALDLSASSRRRARIDELLDLVGSRRAAARYPHQFSGGSGSESRLRARSRRALGARARRAARVARRLCAGAACEPARRPLAPLSLSLLLISHDLAIVRHVADVVSVMYLGVMVETGPTRAAVVAAAASVHGALIGAVPNPDGRGVLPEALPGEVPDPARPPRAAASLRAARTRSTLCHDEDPDAADAPAGRAACWLQTGTDPPSPRHAGAAAFAHAAEG
jgi:peptide/nickel transport system ATP-binding protein